MKGTGAHAPNEPDNATSPVVTKPNTFSKDMTVHVFAIKMRKKCWSGMKLSIFTTCAIFRFRKVFGIIAEAAFR